MDVYHFVKYNSTTSLAVLAERNVPGVTLCFDLEDSIQDIANPANTAHTKALHRQYLHTILTTAGITAPVNIGIRLNAINTDAYWLDLDFMAQIPAVQSIFLSKTETTDELQQLAADLKQRNITYSEIIPVVETKQSVTNLITLLSNRPAQIKSIAFGHCDYNLDLGIFPFFHQTHREYWTWVEKIASTVNQRGLKFINSPFLSLNDEDAFTQMLQSLSFICGYNCGQIVLTYRQAELCINNTAKALPYYKKLPNRLSLKTEYEQAKNYINQFELENRQKGFTISSEERIFLSPHEYWAALTVLTEKDKPNFNFTFIGGCFPVQGNILFEDLFHQHIKRDIENRFDANLNINIVRYERFKNCLQKIASNKNTTVANAMVLSIRVEPVLRLTKLSYKFLDNKGEVKRTVNLPFLNKLSPEEYDLLVTDITVFNTNSRQVSPKKILTNINYLLGMLIGNHKAAFKLYSDLITNIQQYCTEHQIPLFIMSPSIRTNTWVERLLSKKLQKFMLKNVGIDKQHWIDGSDLESNGKSLFYPNGIYVNEEYHRLLAGRITAKFDNLLPAVKVENHHGVPSSVNYL